jgi:DNA-binding GntR family transcriptional regulator
MTQQMRIEDQLRESILNFELLPGEKISERWIEQKFSVSRTPIRTALIRLEAEGLITKEERCWRIKQIDLNEIQQLFIFREILEIAALKITSAHITDESIQQLAHVIEQENINLKNNGKEKFDINFHLLLVQLSGNQFLISSLVDTMQRLSRARWLDSKEDSQGWNEHTKILNAIQKQDFDLASKLLSMHIQYSHNRIIESFEKNLKKMKIYKSCLN